MNPNTQRHSWDSSRSRVPGAREAWEMFGSWVMSNSVLIERHPHSIAFIGIFRGCEVVPKDHARYPPLAEHDRTVSSGAREFPFWYFHNHLVTSVTASQHSSL